MYTIFPSRRRAMAVSKHAVAALGILATAMLIFTGDAFALKSDKDQPMNIDARYQKTVQSKTDLAKDPDITDLDGDVVMTQGSVKTHGDHATIYRTPAAASDVNAGKIVRVILTGKQAHMQQINDGDCSLMTSNANKIDYNPITYIAELTGGVVVNQAGHGEFHGEHMIYNTDTGDMESGDKTSPAGRVHIVMEPKTEKPAASSNNCGFPVSPKAKPAAAPAEKAAPKPAAPESSKPAAPAKTGAR
jgi:lipopolysaccharide export system protein LptA